MTPILRGRWQSRLFLLGTIGIAISILFAFVLGSPIPLINIFLVILFGLGWDILYHHIQTYFWDQDWPAVLQFLAGMFEGIFLFLVIYFLRPFGPPPSVFIFWIHYLTVWLATFLFSQSFMRIFFPRWRYSGGRIISF